MATTDRQVSAARQVTAATQETTSGGLHKPVESQHAEQVVARAAQCAPGLRLQLS